VLATKVKALTTLMKELNLVARMTNLKLRGRVMVIRNF